MARKTLFKIIALFIFLGEDLHLKGAEKEFTVVSALKEEVRSHGQEGTWLKVRQAIDCLG